MTISVPPKQAGYLADYTQGIIPILEGGDAAFVKRELSRLANALGEVILMTPQSAYRAPKRLKDGMIRLSRKPWFPVSGQTTDEWVYWDAAGQAWRYLAAQAPTSIS